MDFLVSERYVVRPYDTFKLTFRGSVFIENGGYTQAKRNSDEREKRQNDLIERGAKTAERLNTFTLLLAIGTFLLVIIEIIKLFC